VRREAEVDETPFGRYRLVELLGRGGMGEVWRAHDTATDRIVAIKVLPAHLSDDEMFQQRFRREAHAATRLNNPHVIPIHDYGEIDGRLYVSMQLIEGHDLQEVLAQGQLSPTRAVGIVEQIAKALHAAHKIGLVHRDVKPSNILLDEDDFAYLIDFGIAHAPGDTRLTSAGFTMGTIHYIAPERLGDDPIDDARGDIYALACVLYECLTGRPPFIGTSMGSLVAAHLNSPPPQPSTSQPNIPPQLDKVIARGMAKDPDERYPTTVELADAARDAIAVPMQFSGPSVAATPDAEATGQAPTRPAPTGRPPQPAHRKNGTRRLSRRTKIAIVASAVAIVAVIAAAVGMPAIAGHRPSGSSPTSAAPPPTSSAPAHSAQTVLPFTGLSGPKGVAVDAAGNLYVVDPGDNRVLKLPAGSSTQTALPFTGLKEPYDVAVDAAGNVYVVDPNNRRVLKLPAGSSTQEVVPFTDLKEPGSVAADAVGNLYLADYGNDRVLKLPADSSAQEVLPFTGLKEPSCVAVDAAGNLYVAATGNDWVLKLPAGSSAQEVLPFTGLKEPSEVTVDAAGNLYVVDPGNKRVLKLPAGSATQELLPFTDLKEPNDVAVDAAGNVYVTDGSNDRVLKLPAR
jgi:serine/threonine-protein kinase